MKGTDQRLKSKTFLDTIDTLSFTAKYSIRSYARLSREQMGRWCLGAQTGASSENALYDDDI